MNEPDSRYRGRLCRDILHPTTFFSWVWWGDRVKQFTLRLDATQQRPVELLKNTLTALLDTGAYIPVWTDDEDILVSELGGKEECAITTIRFAGSDR